MSKADLWGQNADSLEEDQPGMLSDHWQWWILW